MAFLLDSDWLIDYMSGLPSAVEQVEALVSQGLSMSIVSYMELYEGMQRTSDRLTAQVTLHDLTRTIPVVPLSLEIAERCAILRDQLRRQGRRVNQRSLDLIIAATALELGLVLISRNVSDYADIPDLQLLGTS